MVLDMSFHCNLLPNINLVSIVGKVIRSLTHIALVSDASTNFLITGSTDWDCFRRSFNCVWLGTWFSLVFLADVAWANTIVSRGSFEGLGKMIIIQFRETCKASSGGGDDEPTAFTDTRWETQTVNIETRVGVVSNFLKVWSSDLPLTSRRQTGNTYSESHLLMVFWWSHGGPTKTSQRSLEDQRGKNKSWGNLTCCLFSSLAWTQSFYSWIFGLNYLHRFFTWILKYLLTDLWNLYSRICLSNYLEGLQRRSF